MWQLMWWTIFLVPTLAAVVWALWRRYPPGTRDAFDSIARHRRFVEALSQTEREKVDPTGTKDTEDG